MVLFAAAVLPAVVTVRTVVPFEVETVNVVFSSVI